MKSTLMDMALTPYRGPLGRSVERPSIEVLADPETPYTAAFDEYVAVQRKIQHVSDSEQKNELIQQKERAEEVMVEALQSSLQEKGGGFSYLSDIHTTLCAIPGTTAQKKAVIREFIQQKDPVTVLTEGGGDSWENSVSRMVLDRFHYDVNTGKVEEILVDGEWYRIQSERGVYVPDFIGARPLGLALTKRESGESIAMVINGFNQYTDEDARRFVENKGGYTEPIIVEGEDVSIEESSTHQEQSSSTHSPKLLTPSFQLSPEDFYRQYVQDKDPEQPLASMVSETLREDSEYQQKIVADAVESLLNQDPFKKLQLEVVAARQKAVKFETSANPLIMGNKVLEAKESLRAKEQEYQQEIQRLQDTIQKEFTGDLYQMGLHHMYTKEILMMRDLSRDVEQSEQDKSLFSKIQSVYQSIKQAKGWKKVGAIGLKIAVSGLGTGILAEKTVSYVENKKTENQLSQIKEHLESGTISATEISQYISILESRYQLSGKASKIEDTLYHTLVEQYATLLSKEAIEEPSQVSIIRASTARLREQSLSDQRRAGNRRVAAFALGATVAWTGVIGAAVGSVVQSSSVIMNAASEVGEVVTASASEFENLAPGETVWENIKGALESMGVEATDESVEELVTEYFDTTIGKETMLNLASQTEGGSHLLTQWGIDNSSDLTQDQMWELSHYMKEGELEGLTQMVTESIEKTEEILESTSDQIDISIVDPEILETDIIDPGETFEGEFIQHLTESLGIESEEAQKVYEQFLSTGDAQRMAYNEASEFVEGRSFLTEWDITSPDQLNQDQIQQIFETSPSDSIHTDIQAAVEDFISATEEVGKVVALSLEDFQEEYGSLYTELLKNQPELRVPEDTRLFPAFKDYTESLLPQVNLPENFAKTLFEQTFATKKGAESLLVWLRDSHTESAQHLIETFSRKGWIDASGGAEDLAHQIGKNPSFFWMHVYPVLPKGSAPEHLLTYSSQALHEM